MGVDFGKALAGVTALGAGIAVLAGATGAFEQMQRNTPQLTALAFSLAVVAGMLVVGAGWTKGNAETYLGIAGLGVFLIATILGIVLLVDARGNRPPPSIKIAFKKGSALAVTGSIKVEQMTAKETLRVRVVGNSSPVNKALAIKRKDRLLDAQLGSDPSGDAELPLDVPVPKNKYVWVDVLAWISDKPDACYAHQKRSTKNTPGCVAIRIPESAAAN